MVCTQGFADVMTERSLCARVAPAHLLHVAHHLRARRLLGMSPSTRCDSGAGQRGRTWYPHTTMQIGCACMTREN